jgi:DNA replication and repair protein RecF
MSAIHNLHLTNVRNFQYLEISSNTKQMLILGNNGSGKTNILEAISMFTPGRGIRGAKFVDQIMINESYRIINVLMESNMGVMRLQDKYHIHDGRRLSMNDNTIKTSDLKCINNIIWLTPQQNCLFIDSASNRRKYFDRIVYLFYDEHAQNINKYEHYVKERMDLLKRSFQSGNNISNGTLCSTIEQHIATFAILIARARVDVLSMLQNEISATSSPFPKCILKVYGNIEQSITDGNDNDKILQMIEDKLLSARGDDVLKHTTSFGIHRSDFTAEMLSGIPAYLCSTGEQQSMIINITLASVIAAISRHNVYPIALLDEVFTHLDQSKTEYLSELLLSIPIQSWITSTAHELCGMYSKSASVINLV